MIQAPKFLERLCICLWLIRLWLYLMHILLFI